MTYFAGVTISFWMKINGSSSDLPQKSILDSGKFCYSGEKSLSSSRPESLSPDSCTQSDYTGQAIPKLGTYACYGEQGTSLFTHQL